MLFRKSAFYLEIKIKDYIITMSIDEINTFVDQNGYIIFCELLFFQ